MFSLQNILFGLFLIVTGVILVKYNFKLVGITGRQDWIEDKLGAGSTYFAYQIFAVGMVIIGIALLTGLGNNLGHILLDPLKGFFPTAPSGR